MDTIGTRLRDLRKAKGYSQEYMAQLLGISRPAYNQWENGWSTPSRRLAGLAEILGCSTDYLLTGKEYSAPNIPGNIVGYLELLESRADIRGLLETARDLSNEDLELVIYVANRLKL